jgi:S-phase kinase-associated protein 1
MKELQELVEMGECVDSSPIPLFNINSIVLDKVIVWLNYHYNNQNKSFAETNDWDQSFFNCDQQMLFQLLLAANYLNIKGLLNS